MANVSDELRNVAVGTCVVYGENKTTVGGGETAVGFENIILKKGYKGIKEEAEAKLAELDKNDIENFDKMQVYRSMILSCEAMKIQRVTVMRIWLKRWLQKKPMKRENKNC